MLGVLPSEDGSVVLKPLESIAPLVLRELSEHDKDYLTQSPPVLRATPTVPRKKGGKGEAPAFKRAAAAQMNIECCRSAQLVAMCLVLGHIYWTGKVPPPPPPCVPCAHVHRHVFTVHGIAVQAPKQKHIPSVTSIREWCDASRSYTGRSWSWGAIWGSF